MGLEEGGRAVIFSIQSIHQILLILSNTEPI